MFSPEAVCRVVGQAANWQQNQSRILWLSIFMAGALLVMWVVVQRIRRWMRDTSGPAEFSTFSFSDLRKMRAEGRITEEEYQGMHAALMKGARRMLGEKEPDSAPENPASPASDGGFRLFPEGEEPAGEEEPESPEKPDNPPENRSDNLGEDDEPGRGIS